MKLKVQSIHFDADQKLIEFINEKVDRLVHIYEGILDGEVFLRLDRSDVTKNKIAEIKLHTRGKVLFAKEQCSTFEEATDSAIDALRTQLTRHKEKTKNL